MLGLITKSVCRSAVALACIAAGVGGHLSGSVSLLAARSMIMTGSGMPEVTSEWMDLVTRNFIAPTAGSEFVSTPVTTPAQFWPFTGTDSLTLDVSTRLGSEALDAQVQAVIAQNRASGTATDPLAVFGYSQSAWIAAVEKQILMSRQSEGESLPPIAFVMLANPVRPNGGLFSRFPSAGAVTWTSVISAPTDTAFPTYDIARQYDPFADFPADPSNRLAVANALFGLINHDYSTVTINPEDPNYDPDTVVQHYGDTTYYLIPSKLPLLQPLRQSGFEQLADALEPVLTPIIESAYDRGTPYGKRTPAVTPAAPAVDEPTAAARAAVISRPAPAPAASRGAQSVHRTEKDARSRS